MSLQTFKEKRKNPSKNLQGSSFIVPFSRVIVGPHPGDIYNGEESIPFENRDPLFKSILRKEFSNAIKEFNNTLNTLNLK